MAKKGKRVSERLTVREVETKRNPGYYVDGGGLYLQVGAAGGKSWVFRFTLNGRTREMGLGPLNARGLAEARREAAKCRALLLEKIDPLEARNAADADGALLAARSKTFKDCAEAYIKAHRNGWKNAKHAAQWTNTLQTYAYPKLGALPVSKVDTGLVLQVLEPIWNAKPETATRLRGRIESVLDWARVRGLRDGNNPAQWRGHLDKLLPKRSKVAKVNHHPALPYLDSAGFMKSLRQQDGVAAKALELIILTATRTGEAIGAKWDEFDLAKGIWTIPAERMKAKREHKIPLSNAAIAVLKDMKRVVGNAHAFPGARTGKPISNMACLKLLERMKREDLTVHGFRSTFRDWAAERTSFPREVAEAALAHTIGDKVEAAYRRGDLFDKRRRLMEAWAEFCGTTETGSVHPINKARTKAKRAA